MSIFFQLLFVLLLILLNGFFVASEVSLISLRKTQVEELVRKGKGNAKLIQYALNRLSTFISATQLGITIVSIGLGWVGEPLLAHMFDGIFTFLPATLAIISSHTLAIICGFAALTYFHIVLGELAPKSLALQKNELAAKLVITPLVIFAKIFTPFIWLLNISGSFVLTLFRIPTKLGTHKPHSEEEISLILAQSAGSGTIEKEEATMVQKLFQMDDVPITSIMTPKKDIIGFSLDTTIEHIASQRTIVGFSRFPIYKTSLNTIIGYIHVKDLYQLIDEEKGHLTIEHSHKIRKIISIDGKMRIDDVLKQMKEKRVHMAVITDKNHHTKGMVTLENIVESVLGEIKDEFEKL